MQSVSEALGCPPGWALVPQVPPWFLGQLLLRFTSRTPLNQPFNGKPSRAAFKWEATMVWIQNQVMGRFSVKWRMTAQLFINKSINRQRGQKKHFRPLGPNIYLTSGLGTILILYRQNYSSLFCFLETVDDTPDKY